MYVPLRLAPCHYHTSLEVVCIAAFISMYSDEQNRNFVVCLVHISLSVFEVAQVVASVT